MLLGDMMLGENWDPTNHYTTLDLLSHIAPNVALSVTFTAVMYVNTELTLNAITSIE